MKKISYLIACLPLVAGSCSDGKDNTEILNNPKVVLSSGTVSFSEKGGTASVALIANRDQVEITNEKWLTVSRQDGTVTIVAEANPDAGQRNSQIVFSVSDRGVTARDSIRVWQDGTATVDLSKKETANCYVAKTAGEYSFRADVKGNGGSDGQSSYIDRYGAAITGAVYAELLWEATFDGDKNTSRDIIAGEPVYRDGAVHFSTGATQGNAVIALKDAYGTILWSWHIWVSDDEIGTTYGNGLSWMNRNLGALNNMPGDIRNRGLLYQWGRKDPFLPSRAEYMVAEFDNLPAANAYNYAVGDGSAAWEYNHLARKVIEAPGNVEYAVRHPVCFLTNATSDDWFAAAGGTPALWGKDDREKTIFDPCPAGYMVPPSSGWASQNIKSDWGKLTDNGRYWTGGSKDFYPLSGFLQLQQGALNYCGALGMYWTREQSASDPTLSRRLYLATNSTSFTNLGRGSGCLIRCVKQ